MSIHGKPGRCEGSCHRLCPAPCPARPARPALLSEAGPQQRSWKSNSLPPFPEQGTQEGEGGEWEGTMAVPQRVRRPSGPGVHGPHHSHSGSVTNELA